MTHAILALLILTAEPAVQTDRVPTEADEVFQCDFEQSVDRNFDHWPDSWTRRRGRGYPSYLPIEIMHDDQSPSSKNRCLSIRLDGAAAEIYSPPIPVVPQFSYQLTAKLRTKGLKLDVASYSIAFYDSEDHLLEVHESTPLRDASQWTTVSIGPVTPDGDRVRHAVISLHVRPTEQADLTGEVFIDDVWLGRLPKLSVEIGGENGIFTDPKSVRVNCHVSGYKSAKPELKFELLDVYGALISQKNQIMDAESDSARLRVARSLAGADQTGFAGGATWQPPVPRPGFYTVRVSTPSHSGVIMKEEVNFVVMPSLTRRHTGEFGWSLAKHDLPVPMRSMPGLLSQVGVHWVKFPVWFTPQESKRADEIAWFAERLTSFDIQLVGLLDQPPPEVRAMFGAAEQIPIANAFADKAVWHPALDPVMTRLSLKIRWWQLGRDDDTSFSSYPDLPERLRVIRDDLSSFGQRVKLGVPWRAIEESPLTNPTPWAFLSYTEDPPLTDEELKVYATSHAENHVTRWIMLQPLSQREYSLETRTRDLVRRMLAAKIADVDAIFVPEPFDADHGLMHSDGSPGPLLLAWRATAMLIGGSNYAGTVKLPEGSENHVFIRDEEAVMVVWNEQAETESVFLGQDVKQYDVWGCHMPPESPASGAHGQAIRVGPMPTFVTGMNPALAKWRRDFRFETERVASVFGREQPVAYQFTNPFPHGVGGRIKFQVPNDWKVEGAERQFKLAPGETLKDVLRISLDVNATTGIQPIPIDFEITADHNYKFTLHETIQVGLGDVMVQLDTRLDDSGNLIVEQNLINNTDDYVSFKCYLSAPGRRRVRQQVLNHGRGRTFNEYVFPNGKELIGKTILFRAEEIDDCARVLNDQFVAHD